MRTVLKIILFTAALLAGTAHAQVPVTITTSEPDVLNLAKLAEQLQQAKQQYDQTVKQYDSTIGSRGLGSIFNDPKIKSILPRDWNSVLTTIKGTPEFSSERAKFPTLTDSPKKNALFDSMASERATMSIFYQKTNDRIEQAQSLMGQIDSASDPAAKADLQARLISEQNAIASNSQLLTVLKSKQKQELESANQDAIKEMRCKDFKRPNC